MHLIAFCNRTVVARTLTFNTGRRRKSSSRFLNQALRIMRLTSLMLFVFVVNVSATGTAQSVTLSVNNTSLEKVFDAVKSQTGYYFFYNQKQLKEAKPVTIKADHVPLESFLEQLFKDQPLTYLVQNQTIFIRTKPKATVIAAENAAPPITIRGVVRNQNGDLLYAASVYLRPGSVVAQTDKSGFFSIPGVEPGNYVLEVSYVGYEIQKTPVTVGPDMKQLITIMLQPSADKLEEVTVVNNGYQTLSRDRSAGSFAKSNMETVKNRSTSMNLIQRLDGLVPGMVINNAPGSTNVIVRGLSTINASKDLLYVVDGIIVNNIDDVNPNDVQDVTLLKDATAASIWGSRASNGVVVVVTKKGLRNSPLKVEYNGFVNIQGKPDIEYLPYMRSPEFISTMKELYADSNYRKAFTWPGVNTLISGNASIAPHESILYNYYRGLISEATMNAQLDSLSGIDNLQQIKDQWYRTASLSNHTISVRGGSGIYNIYGSLAYTNTVSSTPGEKNRNYKMNMRQEFVFNKNITAYLVTNLVGNESSAGRPASVTNRFVPYQLFKDANGNSISMPWIYRTDSLRAVYESKSGINLNYNPIDEMNYGKTKNNAYRAYITAGITAKIWKGLRFEGVYGYVKGSSKTTAFESEQSYSVRNQLAAFTVPATTAGTLPTYFLPQRGGQLTVTNLNQYNWTVRNQLAYDYISPNETHQLTLLAGQEATDALANTNISVARGYDPQSLTSQPVDWDTLGKGVTNTVFPSSITKSTLSYDAYKETETDSRTLSYYGNAAYTFLRKYTLNGSVRKDQSNLFGKDKSAQNKPIWSAGLAWQLHKEFFIEENLPWIKYLALRATYGLSGNQPLLTTDLSSGTSYDILNTYVNLNAYGGQGLGIATFGNRKLSWEATKTTNFGVDFSVLNSKLSGSVDVYLRRTTNLIAKIPVNAFTGVSAANGNLGNINNTGIDGKITSINIKTKNFSWSTTLVASYNVNKITKLYIANPTTSAITMLSTNFIEGYSAFAQLGYKFMGLDSLGDPMIQLADGKITKAPSAATASDLKYMGTYQPKFTGGFSNNLRYRNFQLSINMVYAFGSTLRRDAVGLNAYTTNLYGRTSNSPGYFFGNMYRDFNNRWKKSGDENITNIPSYVPASSASTSRRSTGYYAYGDINFFDGAYVKLRDINLAYSIPTSLIKQLRADDLTFRVTLSNVLLWKANHYGIDPEFHDSGSGLRAVPTAQHSIAVGANLRF